MKCRFSTISIMCSANILRISRRKSLSNTTKRIRIFFNSKTVDDRNTRDEFKKYLSDKGIKISDRISDYILKYEVARYHKPAIYDLEFDNQLNTALKAF